MKQHIVRVWDLPTRIAHWTLAALVAAAIVAAKIGGNAMVWHGRFGLAILGIVVFRVVWGVVGSTHARFAEFLPTPRALADYLAGRWRGLGHNPLGALSVLALLGLLAFQASAGLFANDDIAFRGPLAAHASDEFGAFATALHHRAEWFLFGLVALHVGAVMFHLHVKKDNLIVPMITGRKVWPQPGGATVRGGGPVAFWFALTVAVVTVSLASGLLVAPPAAAPVAAPAW